MRTLVGMLCLVAGSAGASELPALESAHLGRAGDWSIGLFAPAVVSATNTVELEAHPLEFFVGPHLTARVAHLSGRVSVTGEYGLNYPTPGLRLLKGYFFPSWASSGDNVGQMLVPHLGLLVSGGLRDGHVWTLRAEAFVRLPLGANAATRTDSFLAPVELALAAPLTGFLLRGMGAYDARLTGWLRLRGELNLYGTGPGGNLVAGGVDRGPLAERSPLIVTAHLGAQLAVGRSSRLHVGVLVAGYDQGKVAVVPAGDGVSDTQRVWSTNVLPTLDFIWGF